MGFIKDAKQNALAAEATRARREDGPAFMQMLNTGMTQSGLSGSVSGWAEMIEGIEAAGWALDQWSVSTDTKGRPQAYPLFRRR